MTDRPDDNPRGNARGNARRHARHHAPGDGAPSHPARKRGDWVASLLVTTLLAAGLATGLATGGCATTTTAADRGPTSPEPGAGPALARGANADRRLPGLVLVEPEVLDHEPGAVPGGVPGALVLGPGDPAYSRNDARLFGTGPRALPDRAAVVTLNDWIWISNGRPGGFTSQRTRSWAAGGRP